MNTAISSSHRGEITPALSRKISQARREYINGETISCSTLEEMERYFESM